jgi:signal transduction histidine kinase
VLAIDEAWQALAKRLTRFEQERALMLAGVSHDLRSPLGRIQLAASLLPDTPEVACAAPASNAMCRWPISSSRAFWTTPAWAPWPWTRRWT